MLTAVLRLANNLVRLPLLPLFWLARVLGRPRGEWVHVVLARRLVELPGPRPFFLRFFPAVGRTLPTPLVLLRKLAEHAVRDDRIRGVVIEIPSLAAGWALCAAVRRIVARLRDGGVQVVAYLPEGGGNRELYVASAADRIVIGPQATIMALGLAIESRYMKPLLDKLGVEVQAVAAGEYKTAAESLVRDSMSDAQKEQLGAILATLDGELRSAVSALPNMDADKVTALFERALVRGEEAVEAGVASGVAYDDDLPVVLGTEGRPARLVRAPRYLAHREARFFRRVLPRPYIGVVEVHGAIVSAGGMRRGATDPDHVAAALRAVRRDRFAVGAVLHVNSPGGSALASDQIHREVQRLAEKKPVVACFGDVAASGGYYVAAGAHAIVAEPVTITGSIGVVSARLVARELLGTLGVRTETIKTAPHADMLSASRAGTPEETAILVREIEGFYDVFVDVVARGRARSHEEVDALARGRVWSGADAQAKGLVDRLGGLDTALEEVRARARVPKLFAGGLEPRVVRPRRLDLPPAEPRQAAAALLGGLSPELSDIVGLLDGPDWALYYALGLPRIV